MWLKTIKELVKSQGVFKLFTATVVCLAKWMQICLASVCSSHSPPVNSLTSLFSVCILQISELLQSTFPLMTTKCTNTAISRTPVDNNNSADVMVVDPPSRKSVYAVVIRLQKSKCHVSRVDYSRCTRIWMSLSGQWRQWATWQQCGRWLLLLFIATSLSVSLIASKSSPASVLLACRQVSPSILLLHSAFNWFAEL